MTLGKKIKALRISRGMTQKELAGAKITRNMLSRIENDGAMPSFDTLRHLAEGLGVSLSLLISEECDDGYIEKASKMDEIYAAYEAKSYKACINLINRLKHRDHELNYLLASAYFEDGKEALMGGSLITAQKALAKAKTCAEMTAMNTERIEALLPLYTAMVQNIQSPLLELDTVSYENGLNAAFDIELYKYVSADANYPYTNEAYKKHMGAKALMKQREYQKAIAELLEAANMTLNKKYNAHVVFGIYCDLETCYKQLYDFENAYRYASKKLSLLEGFKT